MALSHKALFNHLITDLRVYLSVDQEISAYLGGEVPVYPDMDQFQYAAVALLNNVLKKFVDNQKASADDTALAGFIESNRLCATWTLKEDRSLLDDILFGTFKQVCHRVFSCESICFDDLTCLSPYGDQGPGVSAGVRDTDLYSKMYGSRLTASSPSIYEIYHRFVSSRPRWLSAEFIRQLHFGIGCDVRGSNLSFVPKTNDTTRSICAEPTLNMWYQRAYGDLLEQVLRKSFGISLDTQPDINRSLCAHGSIYGDFSTIDLKSASDSISLSLLESCLPRQVVSTLKILRSNTTRTPQGEEIELRMVSTMGNGFTFPLQTLLFCCMVEAVYTVRNKAMLRTHVERGVYSSSIKYGNFGVFGDDIIVETDCFDMMCRLLGLCGFRINTTKSFAVGQFRESCGADFLSGFNVRPVYLRDVQAESSRFSFINQLRYWSARTGIGVYRTLSYCLKTVRRILIPRAMPVEVGLHVPLCVIGRLCLNENGSVLYQHLSPRVTSYSVTGHSVRGPRTARHKIFNPDGLMLFAFKGGLRDGSFSVRPRGGGLYRLRTSVSPNWDAPPLGVDLLDQPGWCRWSSDTLSLLTGD